MEDRCSPSPSSSTSWGRSRRRPRPPRSWWSASPPWPGWATTGEGDGCGPASASCSAWPASAAPSGARPSTAASTRTCSCSPSPLWSSSPPGECSPAARVAPRPGRTGLWRQATPDLDPSPSSPGCGSMPVPSPRCSARGRWSGSSPACSVWAGGFIIVPALTLLLGFAMPEAVGTSLLIIAVNAAVALAARLGTATVDWSVTALFALAALAGVLAGSRAADLIAVGAYTATRSGSASDVQDEPTAVSAGDGATSSVRCGCSSPCRLARGDGDGHRSKGQRRDRARRAATIEPPPLPKSPPMPARCSAWARRSCRRPPPQSLRPPAGPRSRPDGTAWACCP